MAITLTSMPVFSRDVIRVIGGSPKFEDQHSWCVLRICHGFEESGDEDIKVVHAYKSKIYQEGRCSCDVARAQICIPLGMLS
jgi:hypothetical protein